MQMIVVIVDKMLKTQIVECSAVVNWIFTEEMAQDFNCFYVWEILHSTIKKMSKQVDKLQNDYVESDDKLKRSRMELTVSSFFNFIC
jgi:nuclear cap-binding protein subunit 1